MGAWSSDKVSSYNLDNPPMRDTTTVLFSGTTEDKAAWVAFRYEASLSTSVNICQHLSTSVNIRGASVNVPGQLKLRPSDRAMLQQTMFFNVRMLSAAPARLCVRHAGLLVVSYISCRHVPLAPQYG
jgi:hypothetical protein